MASDPWEILTRRDIDFAELDQLQSQCVDSIRQNPERAYLLVSEPKPTFTHGRFANREDLLWSDDEVEQRGLAIRAASRGGKWTYHGPGQIVIYPLIQVRRLGYERRAVFSFMNDLRSSVQRGLTSMGIAAELRDRPFGIYVGERKVASFGMALHGGISSNGVAIYAQNQSDPFVGIHACGVANEKLTSLWEEGFRQDWEIAAQILTDHVKKGFKSP